MYDAYETWLSWLPPGKAFARTSGRPAPCGLPAAGVIRHTLGLELQYILSSDAVVDRRTEEPELQLRSTQRIGSWLHYETTHFLRNFMFVPEYTDHPDWYYIQRYAKPFNATNPKEISHWIELHLGRTLKVESCPTRLFGDSEWNICLSRIRIDEGVPKFWWV